MNRAFGGDDKIRVRVSALGLAMLALVSVLASRLWFLQVLAGEEYARAATANRVRLVAIPAPRGKILDRNGKVLVGTRSSLTVGIRRTDLRERETVLPRLGEMLGMRVADIDKRLEDKRVSPYKPVLIADDVPSAVWLQLRERASEFPGVETGVEPVRLYPGSGIACEDVASEDGRCSVAAHVIGYVGEISETELEKLREDGYRLGDEIGRTGIEKTYEQWLRGRPGLEKLEVDARGTVLRSLGKQEPVPGSDVQLSIDFEAQRVAEEALALGIQRARNRTFEETKERFRAPAGGVVVLDAKSGEVVAMASYPTFDLRKFAGGIDDAYWRYLNDAKSARPLLNRALQSAYPPGSTYKPFVAAAALQTGMAAATTRFPCTTEFKYGDRIFRNWRPANTTMPLSQALVESCDTPFYRLGANWWAKEREREAANKPVYEAMGDWSRKFWLGRPTKIDLGGEAKGRIPSRELKRTTWRKNRDRWCERFRKAKEESSRTAYRELCVSGYRWRGGDAVNMSIGQGELQLSPLHVALGYAAIANGGTIVQPHVAQRVVDPATKQVAFEVGTEPLGSVPIAPATVEYLHESLAQVAERGTATYPFRGWPFERVRVAAKTGSAEIAGKQPFSWFASFAPLNDPKYVVVSVVEEAGFGSQVAGPIVRRVMDHLFDLRPSGIDVGGARSD